MPPIPGAVNPGNLCWLNSATTALFASQTVANLLATKRPQALNDAERLLAMIFNSLQPPQPFRTENLASLLAREHRETFAANQQHDALEFLQYMVQQHGALNEHFTFLLCTRHTCGACGRTIVVRNVATSFTIGNDAGSLEGALAHNTGTLIDSSCHVCRADITVVESIEMPSDCLLIIHHPAAQAIRHKKGSKAVEVRIQQQQHHHIRVDRTIFSILSQRYKIVAGVQHHGHTAAAGNWTCCYAAAHKFFTADVERVGEITEQQYIACIEMCNAWLLERTT